MQGDFLFLFLLFDIEKKSLDYDRILIQKIIITKKADFPILAKQKDTLSFCFSRLTFSDGTIKKCTEIFRCRRATSIKESKNRSKKI